MVSIITENTIMTETTTKTTTMEDIIMGDTIMRRNTRITITMIMENMVISITMTVLLHQKKENMNKLPNGQ